MALELARTPESNRESLARSLRNPVVADDRIRDHIRIITGPQPYRHAHFSADQFFKTDVARGTLENVYGQRSLRVTDDFPRALVESLTVQAPDKAPEILYKIGRAWGERLMQEFAPRIEQEYETEFQKLGMSMMLESWWWPLRAAGWGTCRFDFSLARKGVVAINLHHSAMASGVSDAKQPVCHLYAGLFAAAFCRLARRDLSCVELGCAAKGDPHCTFAIAGQARTKAAESHRNDGANAEQILERLTA
jgi:predicted hydrocarbon binding protein